MEVLENQMTITLFKVVLRPDGDCWNEHIIINSQVFVKTVLPSDILFFYQRWAFKKKQWLMEAENLLIQSL
jgi:hypothetical protein